MTAPLTRHWWAIGIRGLIAIAFGVIAFIDSAATASALILVFGAYAALDGISSIVAGAGSSGGPRLLMILGGVAGIAIGTVAFVRPDVTAITLLLFIGYWAIVVGVSQIIAAYRMRRTITGEWLLALNGALTAAFGGYVLVFPGAGALSLVWLIGFYALVSGAMLLAIAFRARRQSPPTVTDPRGFAASG